MNGISRLEFLPQFLCDFDSVHAIRQIVIGKDQIGSDRPASRQFQSGGAVDGRHGVIALFPQEEFEVLAHFRVVLDDQDRSSPRRRSHGRMLRAARAIVTRRQSAARRQRNLNREHGALALQRAHPNRMAEKFAQALDDGQPQARGRGFAGGRRCPTDGILRRSPAAPTSGMPIPVSQISMRSFPPRRRHPTSTSAALGVFQRVRKQVAHHLLEQARIAANG